MATQMLLWQTCISITFSSCYMQGCSRIVVPLLHIHTWQGKPKTKMRKICDSQLFGYLGYWFKGGWVGGDMLHSYIFLKSRFFRSALKAIGSSSLQQWDSCQLILPPALPFSQLTRAQAENTICGERWCIWQFSYTRHPFIYSSWI